jgi:hypothetical protein
MGRFRTAVDIEVPHGVNSEQLAHDILGFVVDGVNMEKYLRVKNLTEEGHTTDPKSYQPRYHFKGTAVVDGLAMKGTTSVEMSYIQDAVSPELSWTISSPYTRYFSKFIRVFEFEEGDKQFLRVTCDVIVEYKMFALALFSRLSTGLQTNNQVLLNAAKEHFENKYTSKRSSRKM